MSHLQHIARKLFMAGENIGDDCCTALMETVAAGNAIDAEARSFGTIYAAVQ